jgi:LacI family transcriptional regulator, galactose operon repressor
VTVTIREVARCAGVSVATVSRVFNDKGPVLEETRERVQRVAGKLRYVPHGAARSLITRRTSTVGVLLPALHGEFFSELIRGIDRAARRSGYHLLVSSSHSEKAEIEVALRAMRGRVDGLIAMCPDIQGSDLKQNLLETFPIVLLNCTVDGRSVDSICTDNRGGAYEMVRHLTALGHRRIAHISGAAGNHDARERLRGYRAGMSAFAEAAPPELEVEGDFSDEGGYIAGKHLLRAKPRPTAIFAANDAMAIGCLAALVEAGRRVPEDVALAGFDDIPIARFMTPSLTSVRVSIADLGARALDRLLRAVSLKNRHERSHETVPTTLVVRNSCGATKPPESRVRKDGSEFRERRIEV